MKHIEVIIPTRNRLDKVLRTLRSIPEEDFVSVKVICDGDFETWKYLTSNYKMKNLRVILVTKHSGTVYCRNMETAKAFDGVICAMDNIEFTKNALSIAMGVFNRCFSNDDGVFGFRFDGIGSCTALALVGQKFLQRYPAKQLFYPKYYHLACQEISSLCHKLEGLYNKRFMILDNKKLATHHRYIDQTYKDGREFRAEDLDLKKKREAAGIVWGYDNNA